MLPADLRERAGLSEGTELVLIESDSGIALFTRDQLKRRVRSDLAGSDLLTSLLADRRSVAAAEDAQS